MKRIALSCSEPLRTSMAGIGVRYVELARRLADVAEIVLVDVGCAEALPELPAGVDVRPLRPHSMAMDLKDCDAIVVQGGWADRVLEAVGDMPAAVDLTDPWLIENLHYFEELGHSAYDNDHRSWTWQLARGDFFLCATPHQRSFYLGWLAAAGRLRPETLDADPTLRTLIDLVPFGIAEALPPHRPVLRERSVGERRILFGGLYDWLDPWTVLEALELLDRPDWSLLLVANPNPESTPQRRWRQVEEWARSRGWWGRRIQPIDWVPVDRRFDLFRDVDALVVGHRDGPETWLSLRTRALDAIAAGCPVVITEGGEATELMRRHGAGRIVPQSDAAAMAAALEAVLESDGGSTPSEAGRRSLLAAMSWERALEPLVRFCREPWRSPTRRCTENVAGA